MKLIKTYRALLVLILCAAAGVTASAYRSGASFESGGAQDVTTLDRRISMLEQRFYTIESSINRLEQQTALYGRTATPSTSVRDSEISSLRGEIESLQHRLIEVECGLSKLDERTLTPALRQARERAGTNRVYPCRLDETLQKD